MSAVPTLAGMRPAPEARALAETLRYRVPSDSSEYCQFAPGEQDPQAAWAELDLRFGTYQVGFDRNQPTPPEVFGGLIRRFLIPPFTPLAVVVKFMQETAGLAEVILRDAELTWDGAGWRAASSATGAHAQWQLRQRAEALRGLQVEAYEPRLPAQRV